MRELGFSRKWDKLSQRRFTTFRFPRKDRDWEVGEIVKVVFRPRSKQREILGYAALIGKETNATANLTDEIAIQDGFPGGAREMEQWMIKTYSIGEIFNPMNKLTLAWLNDEANLVLTRGQAVGEKK